MGNVTTFHFHTQHPKSSRQQLAKMVIFWKSTYAIAQSYATIKLSSYRRLLSEYLNLDNATVLKLFINLQYETNYVVHYRNLISNIFTIGRGVVWSYARSTECQCFNRVHCLCSRSFSTLRSEMMQLTNSRVKTFAAKSRPKTFIGICNKILTYSTRRHTPKTMHPLHNTANKKILQKMKRMEFLFKH